MTDLLDQLETIRDTLHQVDSVVLTRDQLSVLLAIATAACNRASHGHDYKCDTFNGGTCGCGHVELQAALAGLEMTEAQP